MTWRCCEALANAVVHDGYNHKLITLEFKCDKCGNSSFFPMQKVVEKQEGDQVRTRIHALCCVECGAATLVMVQVKRLW